MSGSNPPPTGGTKRDVAYYANLATAAITPLALITTVVTLILTQCSTQRQINLANQQLELSVKTFQADAFYKALKDSRDTAAAYHEGKASEQDVYAVMQGVFLANSIGELGSMWNVFNADNCITMRDAHLRNTWTGENKNRYSKSFIEYMDKVTNNTNNICGDSS
jgi:hypothetical protein